MKFDEWADEQFGKEPHKGKSLCDLWGEAGSLRRLLRIAEQKVKDREEWCARRTSAQYAWSIKDKDKK